MRLVGKRKVTPLPPLKRIVSLLFFEWRKMGGDYKIPPLSMVIIAQATPAYVALVAAYTGSMQRSLAVNFLRPRKTIAYSAPEYKNSCIFSHSAPLYENRVYFRDNCSTFEELMRLFWSILRVIHQKERV